MIPTHGPLEGLARGDGRRAEDSGGPALNGALPTPRDIDEALDEAPLSWFHLKALLTAGMGFFTDAYDLFIIGIALVLIKDQWHLNSTEVGLVGSATLLATMLGAVVFGRLADLWGRKALYGVEAMIMAGAALASAFAPNFLWLVAFRFVLGLGIGGDYPVSGVIMSEYSNRANRGQLVSMVFSMQAVGLVVGPVVAVTLLASGMSHELAWRVMLGLGALPALAVIYLRRKLPESPRFQTHVRGQGAEAVASIARFSDGAVSAAATPSTRAGGSFGAFLRSPRNRLMLLGTAGCWFLLDYAYYGNTISTPLILKSVAPGASLLRSSAWSLIIFVVAAAPGYVLAFTTIDRIGHRRLQSIGFVAMGAALLALGAIPGLTRAILPFLVLYGLSYFFTEFGPNVTTFVIPTEVYAVGDRATGHGIAAGVGKLGAFLGVFLFPVLYGGLGLNGTLLVAAGAAFAGAILTRVLPELRGRSLAEMDRPTSVARKSA